MVSDIEGLTGVYHWAQTKPGNPAYDEARELLMGDLLAAVEGAMTAASMRLSFMTCTKADAISLPTACPLMCAISQASLLF